MPTKTKTSKFESRSVEQLGDDLAQLRDELDSFERDNRITVDDIAENAERWLTQARGVPLLGSQALAAGGRSLANDAILEVAAAFIVSSGEFREWLIGRARACGGSPGFSKLSRKDRDEQVDKMKAEIGALETEIVRRNLEAERGRVETELAALGADTA
jgi:hypothetical protein